jgi:integrase
MAGTNPPQIPDEPPPVLTDDELRRLLKACEGRDFTDRRDAAILRLFLDTGVRVSEAAGIMLSDYIDLDDQVVVVLGQGRDGGCSFDRKTALALDRYLRIACTMQYPFPRCRKIPGCVISCRTHVCRRPRSAGGS